MSFYSRFSGGVVAKKTAPVFRLTELAPTSLPTADLPAVQVTEKSAVLLDQKPLTETVIDREVVDKRLLAEESLDADTFADPTLLERLGPWLWIAPAGLVAVGLAVVYAKRKSLSRYRRSRR